jgi:hypothetical protein
VAIGWVRANSWYWSSEAVPPATWLTGSLRAGGSGSGGRRRASAGKRSRDSICRASAAASARLPAGGPGTAEADVVARGRGPPEDGAPEDGAPVRPAPVPGAVAVPQAARVTTAASTRLAPIATRMPG